MPVEAQDLQIVGVIPPAFVAQADDDERNDSACHVREVQAGDAVETGSKQTRAPWILQQGHAFINQAHPLTNVQQGESNT